MTPALLLAVRAFPEVAPVAVLVNALDLVETTVRLAHPAVLRADPIGTKTERRALHLLRSIQRLRHAASRYLEHHELLVDPIGSPSNRRQLDLF